MKLNDFDDKEYPEHDRTSCSDEHPINSSIDGNACKRCNAFYFQLAEERNAKLDKLKHLLHLSINAYEEDDRNNLENCLIQMIELFNKNNKNPINNVNIL